MTEHIHAVHQGTSLKIEFDDRVYRPGPLTAVLCELMQVRPGDRVVDVGCGTGYLGILAALRGAACVVGIEPDMAAVKWARHNAELNGLKNFHPVNGKALDPVQNKSVDLVISLPPQMPYPTCFNPWRYGGPDGADVIVRMIGQARKVLAAAGGRLYLVHATIANPGRVRKAFDEAGFQTKILKIIDRPVVREDLEALSPGLTDYLYDLSQKGLAELKKHANLVCYEIRCYLATLDGAFFHIGKHGL